MKYFLVVQLPAFALSADRFAVESAFGVHLRMLRRCIGEEYSELVMIAPGYEQVRAEDLARLEIIDAAESGIRFLSAYPVTTSRKQFLLRGWLQTWRWLRHIFREPCIVHAGISSDLARPLMFMASLAGRSRGRKVMFFVDMDFRQHASRLYKAGLWSRRAWLVNRWVYDPLMRLQLWLAPRLFSVCCYKGEKLVRDYGRGRDNVKAFFDTVHSGSDLPAAQEAAQRRQWMRLEQGSFRAVYFGRLAFNKGVDQMIAAVGIARKAGLDLQLRVIGSGEQHEQLVRQVEAAQLGDHVEFVEPVPYGAALFRLLQDCHVSLAAPLMEDTPRSAFDSLARGLPIVAFDLDYYGELEQKSGAVLTTPWGSAEGLARGIVQLAHDRLQLEAMMDRGIEFAIANTQEIWLMRRTAWLGNAAQ
ncbi:MAG: glycosyltransferase [Steroidobacteraceae bacterium]